MDYDSSRCGHDSLFIQFENNCDLVWMSLFEHGALSSLKSEIASVGLFDTKHSDTIFTSEIFKSCRFSLQLFLLRAKCTFSSMCMCLSMLWEYVFIQYIYMCVCVCVACVNREWSSTFSFTSQLGTVKRLYNLIAACSSPGYCLCMCVCAWLCVRGCVCVQGRNGVCKKSSQMEGARKDSEKKKD